MALFTPPSPRFSHVRQFDFRRVSLYRPDDDLPPELRDFEDVRLVHRHDTLAALARDVDGDLGDALDFRLGVDHGVEALRGERGKKRGLAADKSQKKSPRERVQALKSRERRVGEKGGEECIHTHARKYVYVYIYIYICIDLSIEKLAIIDATITDATITDAATIPAPPPSYLPLRALALEPPRLSKVYPSRELPHDHQVDARHQLRLERRGVRQRRIDCGGAQVGKAVESRANA